MYRELEQRLGLNDGSIERLIFVDLSRQYVPKHLKPKRVVARRKLKIVNIRKVLAPKAQLKVVQRRIAKFIEARFEPHPISHAYTKGRGILSNAQRHIGAKAMMHLDLRAFFGSIDQRAVAKALRNLLPDLPADETHMITELCCHKGRLPQGSPVSPIISNLICFSLDIELAELARSAGCTVSRYSDDISFSTPAPHLPRALAWSRKGVIHLAWPLRALIARHGFKINWDKVRFEARHSGLKVTGLIVGATAVSIPRTFRDKLRASLDRWEKDGIEIAARRHGAACSADKFVSSIRGGISYVGQIAGKESVQYQRLLSTFNLLLERCQP